MIFPPVQYFYNAHFVDFLIVAKHLKGNINGINATKRDPAYI
jgi:hypothetical protein